MWDHKIAMATFSTFVRLSSKMAAKFFKKCYEWRCQGIKVTWYSFSRSIPPKFELKLRRHKQGFGKIDTTVVLDKEENWL